MTGGYPRKRHKATRSTGVRSEYNQRGLESAAATNLKIATKLADQVLCLPMYADLTDDNVNKILKEVLKK